MIEGWHEQVLEILDELDTKGILGHRHILNCELIYFGAPKKSIRILS